MQRVAVDTGNTLKEAPLQAKLAFSEWKSYNACNLRPQEVQRDLLHPKRFLLAHSGRVFMLLHDP